MMQVVKLFSVVAFFMVIMNSSIKAENLIKNGSFEESAELSNVDEFTRKGFTVKKDWTKNWIINIGTTPCEISIIEDAGAPGGKKILRVKSNGGTHIFTQESFLGNDAMKISFSAKGESFEGIAPVVKVHVYLYKADGWFGKNYLASTFKLNNDWSLYSADIPIQPDGVKSVKVAFEFEGVCDIDNVKIEKK